MGRRNARRQGGRRDARVARLASRAFSTRLARRKRPRKPGVARKWRRNLLKRLNQRREMVWSRKRRTHKIWYRGARLTVRKNDKVRAEKL